MQEIINRNGWSSFRLIIPVFPEVNIFTRVAKVTTALGPIMIATVVNKIWGWQVEVIDENNYKGPRDNQGLPDHEILQKENPATVVGFYCGLSSTMERVWELAKFYHSREVVIIAGGWHAHYCPEETLKNNIDIVVHGEGEIVIRQILIALKEGKSVGDIPGISFLENEQLKTNLPEMLEVPDLNDLPYPDFGLLKHANKLKMYPIGRARGCRMKCEFCSVRGEPRWARGQHLFSLVNWLVETRRAREFFIVDDRLEEDLAGTLDFFRMISEKYGPRLNFAVQIRLEAAENTDLLEVMRKAGVKRVSIGYESPIDKDLIAMRKGYLSSRMLEETKTYRRYGFWIHGMFMFGYPLKDKKISLSAREMAKRFKRFIYKGGIHSIQILRPVPLVGTDLRLRLEKEGRIFPLELVPWSKYDGSYICFQPDNMTLREFQEIPLKIMRWFYNPLSLARILLKTLTFPIDYLIRGWQRWHRGWWRDIVKYGGHLLIKRWLKMEEGSRFIEKLEVSQSGLNKVP